MKHWMAWAAPCALALAAIASGQAVAAAQQSEPVVLAASAPLDGNHAGPEISRYVFSKFVEHIGRGIYGGVWVGAESPIPTTPGLRNDVLAVLRRIKVPLVRWPGCCLAGRLEEHTSALQSIM